MQLEVTVPEVFNIFKEISEAPEKLVDLMRLDLREMAGDTLTALMAGELTLHLGRKRYERREGGSNHRNGSSPRRFTMKGIGEVEIKVPRDRQGTFKCDLPFSGCTFGAGAPARPEQIRVRKRWVAREPQLARPP